MINYKYHPMHMHLHTCFQSGASMESHMYNAKSLGMRYIRFTDHDSTLCRAYAPSIDLSKRQLDFVDENRVRIRFDPIGETALDFEGDALRISSKEEGGVALWTKKHWHMITLLADVTLAVGVTLRTGSGYLAIEFSERPPLFETAKLTYPLSPGRNDILLRLGDEVGEDLGGLDNALTGIELHVNGGELVLDTMKIDCIHDAREIHRRQKELAESIGEKYGIKPFVGFEVSMAGEHKNCYSTDVPIVDYTKYDHPLGEKEAADYLISHGAVFAYNHPFLHTVMHKKEDITDRDLLIAVRHTAADLIATRLYGASLLEVGFPEGRGKGFTLEHHLMLWDIISAAGLFITGIGDSDSHSSRSGWMSENNFAAWIAADADAPFPVSENEFLESLKAGRVFTADPIQFKGNVDLTCGEAPMGAVISVSEKTRSDPQRFTFKADSLDRGMRVRVIADGEVLCELTADGDAFEYSYELTPIHTVSFTRVEIWNEESRCILLTNPIYIVNTDRFAGDIPECRAYGGLK